MNGFIACIRRCGANFYKVPKAQSMTAFPALTRVENLTTYFQPWPRRFSTYLLNEERPDLNGKAPGKSTAPKTNQSKARPGGKFTLSSLRKKYESGQLFAMVTAYDHLTARLCEEGNIEVILVGDSAGNIMHGYDSTVPVTMDEMVMHCRAVSRTVKRPLVVGDMPFGSYLHDVAALENAARLLKEGGCDAVKLEGGERVADKVQALTRAGIAVMGHIGLTPQSHVQMGGYRVQGKTIEQAKQLIRDAESLQRAGAFAIVLECVPTELALEVTRKMTIPTIGIGAGPHCNGQVLVCADLLGIMPNPPRFVKQYAQLGSQIAKAFAEFREDVEKGEFPAKEHSTAMAAEQYSALQEDLSPSQEAYVTVNGGDASHAIGQHALNGANGHGLNGLNGHSFDDWWKQVPQKHIKPWETW
eukprot:CAMPEP_0178400470 /NCGR_PEP_ID=MMETSP0689_2-20121128/15806_1 /TAXON_ID=160604 /ORGANISM="Amphidinium massartii, Strain CS-259" /LENGTH=414 /DNA_ID=CAMNT_0020021267 /DNA_START=158 /DNA_END=1402 /DNA_ORIENTATION=-